MLKAKLVQPLDKNAEVCGPAAQTPAWVPAMADVAGTAHASPARELQDDLYKLLNAPVDNGEKYPFKWTVLGLVLTCSTVWALIAIAIV